MSNKYYIFYFLLFISIIVVAMPAIPHHHHSNGIICMKDDIKKDDCCATKHHHHQEDDPCCNNDCTAHLTSSLPTTQLDGVQPEFVCITILFTEPLLRFLTEPIVNDDYSQYVYRESLHGTYLTRATGLRAPPALV